MSPSTRPPSPAIPATGRATDPVVDVRDAFCLHPVPDGAVAALRGLTLTVVAGERVVVHGPNGSGKTTLLRVLAGEQRLSAGRAVVAGMDVGSPGPGGRRGARADARRARWRATQLGWVDQHAGRTLRPELDVLANVVLQQQVAGVVSTAARSAAIELMDRLGVAHLADRRPGTLSGGEAQRVAVCAALAHRPQLVLADEPTGELDAESALAVYDALTAAVQEVGAALVLVSHDRRAARVAQRVVRIRDGRLSETWAVDGGGLEGVEQDGEELLVVDDRGWMRLPDAVRVARGEPDAVRIRLGEKGSIVLEPAVPFGDPVSATRRPGTATARPAPAAPGGGERDGGGDSGDGGDDGDDGDDGGASAVRVACLHGVTKGYSGRPVLRAMDLDVTAGRLLVVRGRSGAGKSTLLRILLGLERPDAGTVQVDGVDLGTLDRGGLADLRRRCVSLTGQDVHLAETVDIAANLELARAVRGLADDPALVAGTVESLRLTPLLGREVRLLSGGERQRASVARSLVVRPRLAVLDEPTSQLDEASAEGLVAVLVRAAADGAAVVVASHDPVVVDAADAVLDLERRDHEPVVARQVRWL